VLSTILCGRRDIRVEDRDVPKILQPTGVIIRMAVNCVCGSDLRPYRGVQATTEPMPMGHEYCGVIEEVGRAMKNVKACQFVVGSACHMRRGCHRLRKLGAVAQCINHRNEGW
jgi:threonine dehydrogenase-like Zn-dependent dehydrogenase